MALLRKEMFMSKVRMLVVAVLFSFGLAMCAGFAGDANGNDTGKGNGNVTQGGGKNGKDEKKKAKNKVGQDPKEKKDQK